MQIQIQSLTKSFGAKQVLRGISFQAESGQALGVLGRNGAGKTTTIRIVMNVFPADSGQVLLDGKPINRNRVNIGYLPEERGLYPKKLIKDQLVYFGMLKGLGKSAARKSADRWLDRLEMTEHANRRLDTLSKGNQQKIQLAATLLCDPDIVILDEPFSGLDPVNAQLLANVVREQIQSGKIVLFSSHQMGYIEEFCDNIAILNGGNIVLSGELSRIKRGYDRTRIDLTSQSAPRILPFAQAQPYVKSVDLKEDNTGLIIKLSNADNKIELYKALATQGFDIDSIAVHEPTLNDIFVEYTEAGI